MNLPKSIFLRLISDIYDSVFGWLDLDLDFQIKFQIKKMIKIFQFLNRIRVILFRISWLKSTSSYAIAF